MLIRELLAEGRASLENNSCNIGTPALDAALLLAEVLHCSREALTANGAEAVLPADRSQFHKLLERRLEGECVAYILGRKEFMGLDFLVNKDVLVPRPETETLVETALNAGDALLSLTKLSSLKVLDLCTGSGAIAVSLKNAKPDWVVWASDISTPALVIAMVNAERLLPKINNVNFIESDLLDAIPFSFDIIVSNPPYVASCEIGKLPPEVKREPMLALDGGADGLDLIRRIIKDAPSRLNPQGRLILEAAPEQMETIAGILEACGFFNIKIEKDLAGFARVIGASSKKPNCEQ